MPKKVSFKVVYCTGWEDDYPPKDLEVHSPFVKGWRSPRYCLYPQEIVICFSTPARIRKLQILSHQYMIASKVELYVGRHVSGGAFSMDHTHFTRLGYISLSENGQTGFRSRELKSVNLDASGQLVKLVLHQNHVNGLNLFNQVGLVALNIIADVPGDVASEGEGIPPHVTNFVARQPKETLSDVVHTYLPSYRQETDDPVLLGTINKPSHISPVDDLAFAIAQDPETAELIRRLNSKKAVAVKEERFDYAKQLKQVVDELQKIGEVLCRFEVEKKMAIEREDYDTAKERKLQLDRLRQQVYHQLGINGLMNPDTALHKSLPSHPLPSHEHLSHEHLSHQHLSDRSHPIVKNPPPFQAQQDPSPPSPPQGSPSHQIHHSPFLPPINPFPSHRSPPHATVYHDTNDDRPLPTLVKRESQTQNVGTSVVGVGQEDPTKLSPDSSNLEKPDRLTEKQLKEVSVAVDIFGMETVEYVCGKLFSHRERGLELVREVLSSQQPQSRKEVNTLVRGCCQVLKKALSDKVFSPFTQGLELLKYLVGPFYRQHKLGRPDLSLIVEQVMPVLLTRAGDMTPRIHRAAIDAIMELARHNQIKSFALIGPLLVEPFKQQPKTHITQTQHASWRLAKSRVELLDQFINEVGMSGSGITIKTVMEFICPCLEHTHGGVRDGAIKLTLDLYKVYGREVRRLIPVKDEAAARKKTLWKTVFDGFDRIDGIPTQREREEEALAADKAKKDEIQKLQLQISTLKDLQQAVGGQTATDSELLLDDEQPGPSTAPLQAGSTNPTELDKTCVFCRERRDDFNESGLESHYLNECPMLQPCQFCTQVFEIAGLTKHLLVECERAKGKFRECPRCKEAIKTSVFDSHVKAAACTITRGSNSNRCPLCHVNVPAGDEGWRSHLMGAVNGCLKNPRRKKKPGGRTGIPRAVPGGSRKNTNSRLPQPAAGRIK